MRNKKIQKSQYPLRFSEEYIEEAQKIIDALNELPRSGWDDRGVSNPESFRLNRSPSLALSLSRDCVRSSPGASSDVRCVVALLIAD